MAMFQLIGDKERLSKGPKKEEPLNTKSAGSFQFVGDSVPMSKTPVPLQMHESSKGTFQMIGDKVNMSDTPHKGWASASTPVSDRTNFQSKVSPSGGGKK